MKFFTIKIQDIKILIIYSLLIINLISKALLSESSNSIKLNKSKSTNTQIQKYKFYFFLKLASIKDDDKHPLNNFNYKNVLLSTSQVVYFVSSNPNNSVIRFLKK